MLSFQVVKFRNYILDKFDLYYRDFTSGRQPNFPDFELHARDYLHFCEDELSKNTTSGLINCISHLKRAMDCQLDTFLFSFNLLKLFTDNNLKFERKLEFLKATGIFSSQSLIRLNKIRNKVEHEYQMPMIQDIEVYYDLVSAFVAVLESVMIAINSNLEMELVVDEESDSKGYIFLKYNCEEPSISVKYSHCSKDINVNDEFAVNAKDYENFAFMFKLLFLFYQSNGIVSTSYIKDRIKEVYS